MITSGHSWTTDIYEPETHAFGGTKAMASAHALFRHDSRHLLAYLRQDPGDRRERSLRLCTALMRAATLDLNEQGDVWAKVLEHRAGHFTRPQLSQARAWDDFTASTRQLLTGTARTAGQWHAAFEDAGTDLQRLREAGNLTRGLRAVIALHVIFHWNRIGLPARTQAASPGPPRKPSSAGHRADEPGLAVLTAGAWRIPLSALQPPAVTQVTSHGR